MQGSSGTCYPYSVLVLGQVFGILAELSSCVVDYGLDLSGIRVVNNVFSLHVVYE